MDVNDEIDKLLGSTRARPRAKGPTIDYPKNYIDELERELAERVRVNDGLDQENRRLKGQGAASP